MTSRVIVHATLDEMDDLFNDTAGGFSIRCVDRTELVGENGTFKVVVRHGDDIGYQDGKVFDCQSFKEKFDNAEWRARNSNSEDKISLLETDIEIARRGFEGGLSSETVKEVLKIYGTYHCKDEKYLGAVMKSEHIQVKEPELNFGR